MRAFNGNIYEGRYHGYCEVHLKERCFLGLEKYSYGSDITYAEPKDTFLGGAVLLKDNDNYYIYTAAHVVDMSTMDTLKDNPKYKDYFSEPRFHIIFKNANSSSDETTSIDVKAEIHKDYDNTRVFNDIARLYAIDSNTVFDSFDYAELATDDLPPDTTVTLLGKGMTGFHGQRTKILCISKMKVILRDTAVRTHTKAKLPLILIIILNIILSTINIQLLIKTKGTLNKITAFMNVIIWALIDGYLFTVLNQFQIGNPNTQLFVKPVEEYEYQLPFSGDSGSPLFIGDVMSDSPKVVGLTSWGSFSGKKYAVFTNLVHYHSNWSDPPQARKFRGILMQLFKKKLCVLFLRTSHRHF
uniref:Trypsin n=1 Tax=Megaviridae environmental sample TaxID=1737588 RepID=A0A5J6VJQ8_9VIRU|nr:MAG: trypsin [Megaviridae environmental sample]